ncbi:MAG: response regulator transcription factor [Krumholzibacteria bacterium]|nr:response regulator transcription factor [Candidatus Krumholzibacteria bacterium]
MMRVLIADDERPARRKLRTLLALEADIEIVGEADDGDSVIAQIERHAPDVVLLDIQMPCRDGFAVIDAVGVERMPLVIFVTAYDEHAVRAFEVQALDYLLKPYTAQRLTQVLARARQQLALRSGHDHADRLAAALAAVEAARGGVARILVQLRPNHEVLLNVSRIDFVRTRRNYLEFHTTEGRFLKRGTLTELAGRLDARHFARINRSEIVRLDAIKELQPWFHGDYHVVLRCGTTLTWSRRYRGARERL